MTTNRSNELMFRDPVRADQLKQAIAAVMQKIGRHVVVMHVCGSHEQSIARFGLRHLLPDNLDLIMGPGCPVCVTDMPEVDEAVYLAESGCIVATYGDMLRVPGSNKSLAEAKAAGADVRVIYTPNECIDIAQSNADRNVVFFATGFETTAVATAAIVLEGLPPNLTILSAHKYIPPAMEIVASVPDSRVEGFLAAGHAATITGWKVFEAVVQRHQLPIVVAGFEPLDILAALLQLIQRIEKNEVAVFNAFPRCVTEYGNLPAQDALWKVFGTEPGIWRGIAEIPDGNMRLRDAFAQVDARRVFSIDTQQHIDVESLARAKSCRCGEIMSGLANPNDCDLFGNACTPIDPVGACMVSSEGACKIWHQYGGQQSSTTIGAS